ncbi:hypothetical protein [Pedobacter sp. P26]|uniref:hypothetical protein n=1 Tax=Pedobacter sp. P26 TaxID=3423956 RepID=UPI003D67762E
MACYFPVRNSGLLNITIKYCVVVLVTGFLMYLLHIYVNDFGTPILVIIFNVIALNLILVAMIFIARLEERTIILKYLKKIIP